MKFILLFSFFFSSFSFAAVYGTDTRQFTRNRSVAIMISNTSIEASKQVSNLVNLDTDTIQNNQYMCSSERFANAQSFFVACTGFLIAPDLIMTAGHCAVNFGEERNVANPYCTDFSWYFDFEADSSGRVVTKNIPAENIYACDKIIHTAHTSEPINDHVIKFGDDFALIKLKKAVTNRKPLTLTSERPLPGQTISMVGHPLGGPKIGTKGTILSNEAAYDRAAISGFEGNSGSPVFNDKGEVFGILVRGYPAGLVDNPNDNQCRITNRCTADGKNCTVLDPDQASGDHIMPLGLIPELKEMGLVK